MTEYNIKTKTYGKCRVYPDNPQGLVPSVTSITSALMKYGLVDWAANCAVDYIKGGFKNFIDGATFWDEARTAHKRIAETAADTGTDIHELCQLWLESFHLEDKAREYVEKTSGIPEIQKKMLGNFIKWCGQNQIEPVHVELKLHGDGYSGRCDLVAYRTDPKTEKRVLGLYDIKTTPSYYEEQGLQLAAYAMAYEYHLTLTVPDETITDDDVFRMVGSRALLSRIQEIGIIRLDKKTGSCNFSEKVSKRNPEGKFTPHREKYEKAFMLLKDFYWLYNDLKGQMGEQE